MATLKLNIDAGGAEDGARKFAALLDEIKQKSVALINSFTRDGKSLEQSITASANAIRTAGDIAKGAYQDSQMALAIYVAKLKLEEEQLRRTMSAQELYNATRLKAQGAALNSVFAGNVSGPSPVRNTPGSAFNPASSTAAQETQQRIIKQLFEENQLVQEIGVANDRVLTIQKMETEEAKKLEYALERQNATYSAIQRNKQAEFARGNTASFGAGVNSPAALLSGGAGLPFGAGTGFAEQEAAKESVRKQALSSMAQYNQGIAQSIALQKGAAKATADTTEEVNKASKSFLGFNTSSLGTWTSLTFGLTALYAIRRGFTETIGTISGYEKQLSILNAVTGATASEQKELTKAARDAGINGNFSATENASALVELAKAGYSAHEAISALNGVMAFAINAQISIGQAADTSAKIIRQFNLDSSDTLRVVDSLTTVANSTTTSVENLANAFKYVGPAANSLGIDVETTAAALGIMAQRGIEASLAGTNFKRILTELARPSAEATKLLRAMGVSVEQLNPATNKLSDILKRLRDAHLSLSDARVIFDQRSAVGALVLSQYSDELERSLKLQKEQSGVALKNAEIINDNLVGSWTRLKNTMSEASLQTGDHGILAVMRDEVDGLNDLVLILTGNMNKIPHTGEDKSVANLRNLAEDVSKTAKASDSVGMSLEEAKAKLTDLLASMKAAKPDTLFGLEDLAKIDDRGVSGAKQSAERVAQAYQAALKKSMETFSGRYAFFSGGDIGAPKLGDVGETRDQAVAWVTAMLANAQRALDAAKPLEIKKPQIIDTSLFEDIKDKGLAFQKDSLAQVIETVKEQRKALDDSTISLKTQNKVRAEELVLIAEESRLTKELDKAKKIIEDASSELGAGGKKEIQDAYDKIKAQLKLNAAKKQGLDDYRAEVQNFEIEKQVMAATVNFNNKMAEGYRRQEQHVGDLQAELESLQMIRSTRESNLRIMNEEVAAQREYEEVISKIDRLDPDQHEKYSAAAKARDARIQANTELITMIEHMKMLDNLSSQMGDSFGKAFEDMALATTTVNKAVEGLIRDIQQQFLHELFTKPFVDYMSNMLRNLLGSMSLFGGSGGGITGGENFFVGGYSHGGQSAMGDAFGPHGDIISQLSRMPTGRSVGEKSGEGILPLGRDSAGRLGVHVLGTSGGSPSSSQTTVVNRTANVTVYARDVDSFKKTQKQIASDMRRKM